MRLIWWLLGGVTTAAVVFKKKSPPKTVEPPTPPSPAPAGPVPLPTPPPPTPRIPEPGEIPAKTTLLTTAQAREALSEAYSAVVGGPPSVNQLDLLTAMSAFETGHWKKLFNFNFGNVTDHKHKFKYYTLRAKEIIDGKEVFKRVPFRSFNSAIEGATHMVSLLVRKYPKAWDLLDSGDPPAFVRALKAGKYFTGSVTDYSAGVNSIYNKYQSDDIV